MAQTGYTPISIYYSSTATNVPTAGNLVAGELAINTADGKLFYKDSSGVVQVIAGKGGAGVAGGSNTQVQYNSSGNLAGSANMTFNGTTLTLANDASISGLTVGKGAGSIATNTGVGNSVLSANTTGVQNSAFGYLALNLNTTGVVNNAFGGSALTKNTTGGYNSSFGGSSLANNVTNSNNSAFGFAALYSNTADNNTAVGYQAGYSNTTGTTLDAFGAFALYHNTTGTYNSAYGYNSLSSNTTGGSNVAMGKDALQANTTASNNTAVGYQAGYTGTTAEQGTFVGYQAGYGTTTGGYNVAVGYSALKTNSTGYQNTAVGYQALVNSTTANNNVALGWNAANGNTTGTANTALGLQALYSNTTASNNTAVGYQAGYSNTTGVNNVFVGSSAGANTTGGYNTFVGTGTLAAGFYVTSGTKNTIIGGYGGNQGGLDIRTASNYIVLSDGDGNPRIVSDGSGNVGIGNTGSTSFKLNVTGSGTSSSAWAFRAEDSGTFQLLGARNDGAINTGTRTISPYNNTTASAANLYVASDGFLARSTSSLKYKIDVQDATHGLESLLKLRSVTYKQKNPDANGNAINTVFGGLIAEEVDAAGLTEFVQYAEDGTPDALAYGNMVSLCVKAIQELNAEVQALKQQLGK
jgi:hypothetical protein